MPRPQTPTGSMTTTCSPASRRCGCCVPSLCMGCARMMSSFAFSRQEFFDILVPQLQRSTLALLKSPESVACLTGVLDKAPPDRLIEDRERVVMAEKGVTNTAKAVIDTCLRTGMMHAAALVRWWCLLLRVMTVYP
eukprot:scaffold679_cov374-Prasinococcus_capsulatus_cf.AAC.13